jgi:ribulose bisphosphate carboxylase small subunit
VPDGSARRIDGAVTDAAGRPVPGLDLTIERKQRGGSWASYRQTGTRSNGAFAFQVASSSPRYLYYRVRSARTDAYAAGLSKTLAHEARHDPFASAQIQRMIRSVRAGGLKVGVGLVDRRTGRTYNYGYGQSTFYTASVAKVMVAMDVLRDDHVRGRSAPSSANASRLRSMIRNSNDAITWSYWRSRGQSALVTRVNRRCGTSITVHHNTWSMSRPSPVQMAKVLDCLADHRALNPKLSSWLVYQMRSVNSSQRWGIPAANPDPYRTEANKNGWWRWPCCYFWTVNSTGIFGPGDRYAFTVFTQYGGASPQSRGERQAFNVTRSMFPWGTVIY